MALKINKLEQPLSDSSLVELENLIKDTEKIRDLYVSFQDKQFLRYIPHVQLKVMLSKLNHWMEELIRSYIHKPAQWPSDEISLQIGKFYTDTIELDEFINLFYFLDSLYLTARF